MSAVRSILALLFMSFLLVPGASAEEIRDYYAEPGLNPFKETIQSLNEHIDPFSGTLQQVYTDLVLPGNGGMDIRVHRVYTSLQEEPGTRGVTGVGWTMHFGRIVVPKQHADKICSQELFPVSVTDNPSIEFSDGQRELLVLNADGSGSLITKSNWKAQCLSSGMGMRVTSPEGMVYVMDQYGYPMDEPSWYTSRIQDPNGNVIEITYKLNPKGYLYIDRVTGGYASDGDSITPDGRVVQYDYLDEGGEHIRLWRITANDQSWEYHYTPIADFGNSNYYHLTEVIRPDGLRWKYEYHPRYTVFGQGGSYSLETVTYPYGGRITYSYSVTDFDPDDSDPGPWTTTVSTKATSGPDIQSGTWTYTYEPASFYLDDSSQLLDVTTVEAPNGTRVYYHSGYSYASAGTVWSIGLLILEEVYEGGKLIDQFYNEWGTRVISDENYWHGRDTLKVDNETSAPLLIRKQHWRQGTNYITGYSNFDAYGHPQTVSESSNVLGDDNRITHLTYFIDSQTWIINRIEDETIEGIGTVDRTFDAAGNLLSEVRYGVATTFTYTPRGDLATRTDAKDNTVTYSDYHRGIPQREEYPEGVVITRVVNDTGTVASLTNGRGYTKQFTYDGLNQLTGITYPIHAPVSIDWTFSGKELTRGHLKEIVTFDGFGQPIAVERRDTLSQLSVTKSFQYDALGQKVFESYPNAASGVRYSYDVLGRLVRLEHPDGTFKRYQYGLSGHEVTETNEQGVSTVRLYRAYGDPDNKPALLWIKGPEMLGTLLYRNKIDVITKALQGQRDPLNDGYISGYFRTLNYDSRYFLTSEEHPETGTTLYGRDEVGNMISRQVGVSGVTQFRYDELNRLIEIDYPGTTPDVMRLYDANGNPVQASTAEAVREYGYDENDNLVAESLSLNGSQGRSYTLEYGFDALDQLSTLTYPSGRQVRYSPDALGRPQEIAPYVNGVDYHPSGQVKQLIYANGRLTDMDLTERLWVARLHAYGQDELIDLNYQYDPLGNVTDIVSPVEPAYNRHLGYDGLDRLIRADGVWGAAEFSYDVFDNLTAKRVAGTPVSYEYSGLKLTSTTSAGSRTYYSYDPYGSLRSKTSATSSGFILTLGDYLYDDAGQLRTVSLYDGTLHDYRYEAGGLRVSRTEDGHETHFVYGQGGKLLGEYTAAGPFYGREYMYLGHQLIVSVKENEPPLARAGSDQTVEGGARVTLSGSGSVDPDGRIVNYAWVQTAGPAVALDDPSGGSVSFTAPLLAAQAVLSFELTVTDDHGAQATDAVSVTVKAQNQPPVAEAGPEQVVLGGQAVSLDGRGSRDPDGRIVSYAWAQTEGPTVALTGAQTPTPTLTPPVVGEDYSLIFELTVTDEKGAAGRDTVTVRVLDPAVDTDGDGISNRQEIEQGTDPLTPDPVPAPVASLWVVPGEGDNVIVWDPALRAGTYDLYWSTSPGVTKATGTRLANVQSPFLHTGLANGTRYYYLVVAVNNSGESLPSPEASGVPGLRTWLGPEVLVGTSPSGAALAVNSRGEAMAVWIELNGTEGAVWARSYTVSQGWGTAKVIVQGPGQVRDMRVALSEAGDALVVWRHHDGVRYNLWSAAYTRANGSWGMPRLVETYDGGIYEKGSVEAVSEVVFDSEGRGLVAWTQELPLWYPSGTEGRVGENVYVNHYRPGVGWGMRRPVDVSGVGSSSKPRLVGNARGQAALVWKRSHHDGMTYTDHLWVVRYEPGSGWREAERLDSQSKQQAFDPGAGIDGSGNVLVAWSEVALDQSRAIWVRRYDVTAGQWGLAERRSGTRDAPYSPALGVNARGEAVLIWQEVGEVVATRTSDWRIWSTPEVISRGRGLRGTASRPQVTLDAAGNALVTWLLTDTHFYRGKNAPHRIDPVAARYAVATQAWADPVLIGSRQGGNAHPDYQLRLDPYGNGRVLWRQDKALGGGTGVDLYLNRYAVPLPPN